MKISKNWLQNVFKLKTFVNLQNFHRLFYTFHKFFHPQSFSYILPNKNTVHSDFSPHEVAACSIGLCFSSPNFMFRSFLLLLLLCTMNWWNEFFFLSVNMKTVVEKNNGKNVLSINSDGKSILLAAHEWRMKHELWNKILLIC